MHKLISQLKLCCWSLAVAGTILSALADQVTVECPLKVLLEGANATVYWRPTTNDDSNIGLQSAPSANGPWSTIASTTHPLTVPLEEGASRFFRAVLTMPTGSSEAPQIAQLVRDFSFSTKTNLNPATVFDIQVMPVAGLWETLRIQVVKVKYLIEGHPFNEFAAIIQNGKVTPLGESVGGYGLMSGLIRNEAFYYTYSWGSGIHRSHVGKLRVVDGELKFWDCGGFIDLDLFLSPKSHGEISVVSGQFNGYNQWLEPKDYGRIDETDPTVTKLIGLDGGVLGMLLPANP